MDTLFCVHFWRRQWTLATNLGSEDQFDSPFMDYPLTEACDLMTSSSDVLSNWAKVGCSAV